NTSNYHPFNNNTTKQQGVNNNTSNYHPFNNNTTKQQGVNNNTSNYHPFTKDTSNYHPFNNNTTNYHPSNTTYLSLIVKYTFSKRKTYFIKILDMILEYILIINTPLYNIDNIFIKICYLLDITVEEFNKEYMYIIAPVIYRHIITPISNSSDISGGINYKNRLEGVNDKGSNYNPVNDIKYNYKPVNNTTHKQHPVNYTTNKQHPLNHTTDKQHPLNNNNIEQHPLNNNIQQHPLNNNIEQHPLNNTTITNTLSPSLSNNTTLPLYNLLYNNIHFILSYYITNNIHTTYILNTHISKIIKNHKIDILLLLISNNTDYYILYNYIDISNIIYRNISVILFKSKMYCNKNICIYCLIRVILGHVVYRLDLLFNQIFPYLECYSNERGCYYRMYYKGYYEEGDNNSREVEEGNSSDILKGVKYSSSEQQGVNYSSNKQQGVNYSSSEQQGVNYSSNKQQGVNYSSSEQQGVNYSSNKQQGVNYSSSEQQGVNYSS
ncbi:hypothetical protein CWI38_2680p0010, partial [Hamiltosporidium tvaerminnensis]